MCGRYRNSQTEPDDFELRYGAYGKAIAGSMGQIEVRPTDQIAIVHEVDGARVAESVRWGIQPPGAKRPLINARDDKLLTAGIWKKLVAEPRKRVLIPADGWYEWLAAEDPKVKKQPFLHLVDGGVPFAFAGLLSYAIVKDELVSAATIITTHAEGVPAQIHERMPVVLSGADAEQAWLTEPADDALVDELCVPLTDGRVAIQAVSLGGTRPAPRSGGDELRLPL